MYYTKALEELLNNWIKSIEEVGETLGYDYKKFEEVMNEMIEMMDGEYDSSDKTSLFYEQVYYILDFLNEHPNKEVSKQRFMLDVLYEATVLDYDSERNTFKEAYPLHSQAIQDLIYEAVYHEEAMEDLMSNIKKAQDKARELLNIHDNEEITLDFSGSNVKVNGEEVSKDIAIELFSIMYSN